MKIHTRLFTCLITALVLISYSHSLCSAGDKPLTVVALGDSTTAGTPGFRSPAESPPNGEGNPESQYAHWMLQRHPDWKVMNRGINGQRSDQILRRFDQDVLENKPDVLIVLAGVNDLYQGVPVQYIQDSLKEIYTKAEENNIKVIACTVLPYNNITPDMLEDMMILNRWIKFYAKEKNLGFSDTFGAAEDPENPRSLPNSPDGLHPDVTGYRKIGNAITDEIERYYSN